MWNYIDTTQNDLTVQPSFVFSNTNFDYYKTELVNFIVIFIIVSLSSCHLFYHSIQIKCRVIKSKAKEKTFFQSTLKRTSFIVQLEEFIQQITISPIHLPITITKHTTLTLITYMHTYIKHEKHENSPYHSWWNKIKLYFWSQSS